MTDATGIVRVKPAELHVVGPRLSEVVEEDARAAWRGTAIGTLIVILVVVLASLAAPVAGLFFGLMGLLLVVLSSTARWQAVDRKRAKVNFTVGLLDLLRDDLHPDAKVRVNFDLRHYAAGGKQIWRGLSSAGNLKVKYSDKWLHLSGVLADGTQIRITRQAGIKVKKGSVVREKRRLFLRVVPSPARRAALGTSRLAQRLVGEVKEAVSRGFHDRPEALRANVTRDGGALVVKVVQEDAPILPEEVILLLDTTVRFLSRPGGRKA